MKITRNLQNQNRLKNEEFSFQHNYINPRLIFVRESGKRNKRRKRNLSERDPWWKMGLDQRGLIDLISSSMRNDASGLDTERKKKYKICTRRVN